MDSTIVKNLREDNPMDSLNYYWCAELINGALIYQVDSVGIEHSYQEVKQNFNNLAWFYLYHKDNPKNIVIIDLINGGIYINKITLDLNEERDERIKYNIRLIYYRTIRRIFDFLSMKETRVEINYNLGFQYNDENGSNKKIILKIDNQGNIIIGD